MRFFSIGFVCWEVPSPSLVTPNMLRITNYVKMLDEIKES